MTRVVAIVPMRHSSERVKGKNYRPLGDRPLYHWIVQSLLNAGRVDEVVIDTDSPTILEDAASAFPSVTLLERPAHLRAGEIPMTDVLLNTIDSVDADVILQTHSTNPFLRSGTIDAAVSALVDHECDSVFGVNRLQARLWTADGRAVNHDPEVLLRTQDLEPLFIENSCFYLFEPDLLRATGRRIGATPSMIEVPPLESWDIDEEDQFTVAEVIAAGLGRRP